MKIEHITLDQTTSTNNYLLALPQGSENIIRVVSTSFQHAGRGQGTNHWESEEGKNLLFSFDITRPNIKYHLQFYLSMACALATKEALERYTNQLTLKWPNDIYWQNKKIGGILIELKIDNQGIKQCVFGVGLNINQRVFTSNAPNPVSLFHIINKETNPQEVLKLFLTAFIAHYKELQTGNIKGIYEAYKNALYRKTGYHLYKDKDGVFSAILKDVLQDGTLILYDKEKNERQYAFKEVEFLLQYPL